MSGRRIRFKKNSCASTSIFEALTFSPQSGVIFGPCCHSHTQRTVAGQKTKRHLFLSGRGRARATLFHIYIAPSSSRSRVCPYTEKTPASMWRRRAQCPRSAHGVNQKQKPGSGKKRRMPVYMTRTAFHVLFVCFSVFFSHFINARGSIKKSKRRGGGQNM